MTVSVPGNDKSGAAAKAAQITAVSARTDYQSVQLTNQLQIEQVQSLLDQKALVAANIISTLPVAANAKRNSLYGAITAQNALITAYANQPPVHAATAKLEELQRQLVVEEMHSGARTAASILSGMTYVGSVRG